MYRILRLCLALGIVESLRFVQVLPQLNEPAFAFCFRLCVQQWNAGMKFTHDAPIYRDCRRRVDASI
jgi:hypothetical protein